MVSKITFASAECSRTFVLSVHPCMKAQLESSDREQCMFESIFENIDLMHSRTQY